VCSSDLEKIRFINKEMMVRDQVVMVEVDHIKNVIEEIRKLMVIIKEERDIIVMMINLKNDLEVIHQVERNRVDQIKEGVKEKIYDALLTFIHFFGPSYTIVPKMNVG
jgi:hypothetical protein